MAKKLWSIFTGNEMDRCFITGRYDNIERHHIFEGRQGFKKKSEELGFVVPLHRSIHPNSAFCTDKNWVDLQHWLCRKCQEYFIEIQGHSRQEWYDIFGKFFDDRSNEKTFLNETFQWDLRGDKDGDL